MLKRLLTGVVMVFCPLPSFSAHNSAPAPEPEQRIPVEPLGYRPPGTLYMLSNKSFSTLDFIDEQHLLFTFHRSRLLRRDGDADKPEHSDQVIQAVTLKLPGGQVEASAEWRMHDRSRYLWSLGDGKFLVRQGNAYALTDAGLQLSAYVQVSTPVFATQVSPDGRILVIEHEFEKHSTEQHNRALAQAEKFGDGPPPEDTQVTLMETASRRVLGALHIESPVTVPVTATGYVGVLRDKEEDQFLINFVPFEGKTVLLGKVASTCTPRESFVNEKELVIESCGPKSSDTYLDAWTTEGKKLWNGIREGHFVWPTLASSFTGARFAVGLLHVSHPINLADSLNDEDVREQVVQVYDAITGVMLFSTTASPVSTAGQNFALSADGNRLAVLRQGAIEIYRVPAASDPANVTKPAKK